MKTKFNVVGIGEVLWDLLLTGRKMGGAPANFAYHAHALGASSHAITRVGRDELGREIQARFRELSLPTNTVQEDDGAPTGTAKVSLSGDGLAHFTIQENVAWDYLDTTPEAQAVAREADAICFGSLAQRSATSRKTIHQLVASAPRQALRIFDVNLRQQYYSREVIEQSLCLANLLKLNDDELLVLSTMFSVRGSTENQIEQLAKRFSTPQAGSATPTSGHAVIALTRGARGSLLYRAGDGRWSDCQSRPVDVVDTVGAGDSFTAALVLGLLHHLDLDEINSFANEVARYVCSQAGATPPMPAEFADKFRALSSP
ncbi:MAG: carbohydrate kinase [Terriglobales bacterium]